jgi:ribonuclease BN (tRNA processing enzyme)
MSPPLSLTILGSGPAAPNPGGANSGYLVREGDCAVVMDCGPGTAGQVALHLPPRELSGVAISHFHPDHYFDLVALYYLLKFGPSRAGRLPVWVPPGGRHFLDRLGQLIADRPQMLEDVFDLCEYPLGSPITIGDLEFTFIAVKHYVPSHAMRVRGTGGGALTFSSDVAPCDALPVAARGADLFMCESALLNASQDDPDPAKRGHMSAVEAGQAATAAGARRLLITHYRSSNEDDAHHLAAARSSFDGPVDLARSGVTYTV